jgi:hypothetical protein
MALKLPYRVHEKTQITWGGTGTVNLDGAVTSPAGRVGFVTAVGTGNEVVYLIDDLNGNWELGRGTVTDASPDTLSRDTVYKSSNSDALVSFPVGQHDVVALRSVSGLAYTDESIAIEVTADEIRLDNINGHGIWGGRNILDNPDFRISQRGTSVAGVGASSTYHTADRWRNNVSSNATRWTQSIEATGGPRAGAKWLKMLCTTADAAPGTDDLCAIEQRIQAQHVAPYLQASTGIKPCVFSGKVYVDVDAASSLSAPFTMGIWVEQQDGAARQYVSTITIANEATWTDFELAAPADASGQIDMDNGEGFRVGFMLMGGSGRITTGNVWENNANDFGATGSENFADAVNNIVGFADLQLEPGVRRTALETRPYHTELIRCWHYFQRINSRATGAYGVGQKESSTQAAWVIPLLTDMRAIPSISVSAAGDFDTTNSSGGKSALTSIGTFTPNAFNIHCKGGFSASGAAADATILMDDGGNNSYIDADADL